MAFGLGGNAVAVSDALWSRMRDHGARDHRPGGQRRGGGGGDRDRGRLRDGRRRRGAPASGHELRTRADPTSKGSSMRQAAE